MTVASTTVCRLRMRRRLVVYALLAAAVAGAAAALFWLRDSAAGLAPVKHDLGAAFVALGSARPAWLWAAAALFAAAVVCSAEGWRTAFTAAGARLRREDAIVQYALGSLVNAFTPAHLGEATRAALFSRALPKNGRLLTASGVILALSVVRALVLGALVLLSCALGLLPVPRLAALAVVGAALALVVVASRSRRLRLRAGPAVDAVQALTRSRKRAAAVTACFAGSAVARVGAAAAVAAALGVGSPVAAALVLVPAVAAAVLLGLTPGNLAVTSGAAALALRSRGVPITPALATGIAFHAVETVTGLALSMVALLRFASAGSPARTRAFAVVCGCLCMSICAAVAVTAGDVI